MELRVAFVSTRFEPDFKLALCFHLDFVFVSASEVYDGLPSH